MYSDTDLDAAVASGAITPDAAAALRAHSASDRASPAVDEEHFRLITGFNDIFVSIAALLMLFAVAWIGSVIAVAPFPAPPMDRFGVVDDFELARRMGAATLGGGIAAAAAAWGLAEYFTRTRRMALPSILLLLAFVIGVATAMQGLVRIAMPTSDPRTEGVIAALAGIVTAGAAYAHWRRFRVPITIAALTAALVATLLGVLLTLVPTARDSILILMLAAGLAVFAFAMWWDMSDLTRTTRRSDVAFWLHLFAAPMIAHPIFSLLGVLGGDIGPARALLVLALYFAFGIIALAVDRRALLVSSLIYVLWAMSALFNQVGAISLSVALTALVIGSALLTLSAFWQSIRRRIVAMLPSDIAARLPATDRPALSPRPAA